MTGSSNMLSLYMLPDFRFFDKQWDYASAKNSHYETATEI